MRRFAGLSTIWLAGAMLSAAFAEPAAVTPCTACHGDDGMGGADPKVPIIAGVPAAHIEEALYAYLDGARTCVYLAGMCEIVRTLSEEQLAAAADYYASLERAPSREAYDAKLAAQGADLHEERCAICHVPPDDEDVSAAFGYPLHGQKKAYLEMALEAYRSGKRESLYAAMGEAIAALDQRDFDALLAHYASWRRDGNQSD